MVLLYIFLKPHHQIKLNFVDGLVEIAFFVIHVLILIFGIDDLRDSIKMEEQVKDQIGWIIIFISVCVLIVQVGLIVLEEVTVIKKLIKNIRLAAKGGPALIRRIKTKKLKTIRMTAVLTKKEDIVSISSKN